MVHPDPDILSDILARNWAPIFAAGPTPSSVAMRPFFGECSRLPVGEVVEPLSLQEFMEAMRHTSLPSPPGPDGLPFSVLAMARAPGAKLMYSLYH